MSSLADFIKLPNPTFLANRSPSSRKTSCSGIFCNAGSGEARRVGGREGISISMSIEDRRRNDGFRTTDRRAIGLGGDDSGKLRTMDDGRSNDQERTRSRASTWQPKRNCKEETQPKGYIELAHSAEHTSYLQDKVEFSTTGDFACSLRSLQCL
jgi:hypothetical protein